MLTYALSLTFICTFFSYASYSSVTIIVIVVDGTHVEEGEDDGYVVDEVKGDVANVDEAIDRVPNICGVDVVGVNLGID